MKPFFKWSGGKSRELKKILKHVPTNYDTYYEPFVGAGAVWLGLEPEKSIVNDNYADVINFYNVLKQDAAALMARLNQIADEYNSARKETKEEFETLAGRIYYYYRDHQFDTNFDNAVKFYVLRQLSFSGMLRFNKDGKFNVPFGWYKQMKSLKYDTDCVSGILENTSINCGDWKSCVKTSTKNDFVFLDPPYTRKFQKYHPNGEFSLESHIELADWFKSKQSRALIIINKDDFTYNLYKDYLAAEYGFKYSIQFRDRMKKEDTNAKHLMAKNF
jgi:DNA adenine methylase